MKISLITTVFNEESTIIDFLTSIKYQTLQPNEIIIVDAESTDRTVEKIKQFNLPIKLFIKKGNRSVGRNEAIKNATGDIIAVSDVGCILDKDWLKTITTPFKKNSIDVVSGFYKPVIKNIFQRALSTYTSVMPDHVNPHNFLPSSRSVAFRKTVWKKINGYPEELDTCEDLVFDKKLQKIGSRFIFQKNALVYWPQRKNIFQACKQFFSYAKGDGMAHYFRKSTPLLFLRYLVGLSLFRTSFLLHIPQLLTICYMLLTAYILWSILKNYKYVHHWKALFYLPLLQFTSDIAVIVGTTIGYIQSLKLIKYIQENKYISIIIFCYSILTVSSIMWGIPNQNHPFNYHMDEWAQSQSIRALFRHGTANISGASHGAVFQYFLSGIYLIPFIIFGVVNPFIIKTATEQIDMQTMLFVLLRINTLLFGIGGIITIGIIAKKYLKISPIIAAFLFTVTPIFLTLSNYFKYDIALIFWILLSIAFTFHYGKNPTHKKFLILGFLYGLTLSTKISAIPLFFSYIFSFFLFTPNSRSHMKRLSLGIVTFVITFFIFGIPDIFISFKEYASWFQTNLVNGPHASAVGNHFEQPILTYLLFNQYPAIFGKIFYIWFVFSFFVSCIVIKKNRFILFLIISLILFAISLIPLKFEARGNRVLVLLPYLALIGGFVLSQIFATLKKSKKYIFISICIFACVFQLGESLSWISLRVFSDPRTTSSQWITQNIPQQTTIGILNIPIFQATPDLLLKEFYEHEYNAKKVTLYKYQVINTSKDSLPSTIVMTNYLIPAKFSPLDDKTLLYKRLMREQYHMAATFQPNFMFYNFFNTKEVFYFSGLVAMPSEITIFQK